MTNAPADLLGFRKTAMALTGLTNPADLGIVGDGIHARTGGYHEGKDVLSALGVLGTDYSDRLARDKAGLTLSASALDIADDWPRGGRAAWLRYNNLLFHALQSGDSALAPLRAINFSRDGVERKRIDREHGFGEIDDSSDSVTIHTHHEWYRDTEGKRQGCLDRLAVFITAAINNTAPEDTMAGEYSPDTARAIAVGATSQGYVQFTDPKWDDDLATYNLKAVEGRIVKAVTDSATKPVAVTMSEADRQAIVASVLAGLPKPPTAAEIADELAARLSG